MMRGYLRQDGRKGVRNIVVVDVGTGRPRREPPGSPKTIDLDEGEFRSDSERDPRSPGDGL